MRRSTGSPIRVSFTNGVTIYAGEVRGLTDENQIRRIQIRETIKSHLERERSLFHKGIKVLSLFFIDEVAKYKVYDDSGKSQNGEYGNIFEEEYREEIKNLELSLGDESYLQIPERNNRRTNTSGILLY